MQTTRPKAFGLRAPLAGPAVSTARITHRIDGKGLVVTFADVVHRRDAQKYDRMSFDRRLCAFGEPVQTAAAVVAHLRLTVRSCKDRPYEVSRQRHLYICWVASSCGPRSGPVQVMNAELDQLANRHAQAALVDFGVAVGEVRVEALEAVVALHLHLAAPAT
jgi:hypothetical protein